MLASDITPERRVAIIERIASRVVDLKLTPLAIVMLESSKPLSFIGSQLMVFFQPIITAIFPFQQYDEVAALLEDRTSIEELIQTIERREDEKRHAKRENRANPGN